MPLEISDRLADALKVQLGELRLRSGWIDGTVGLRVRNRADFRIASRVAPRIGQPPDLGAVAVVAGVRTDDAPAVSGGPRHEQRDFARFRAGAAEDGAGQGLCVQVRKPFGVVQDSFVEVSAVDVQRAGLGPHRRGHTGIAVTNTGHVVVEVHVPFAGRVINPDAIAPDDVNGLRVEQGHPLAEQTVAAVEEVTRGHGPHCLGWIATRVASVAVWHGLGYSLYSGSNPNSQGVSVSTDTCTARTSAAPNTSSRVMFAYLGNSSSPCDSMNGRSTTNS